MQPTTFVLAHYINEETGKEFVVILSPGESMHEYETNGFVVDSHSDLDEDCTTMPTDRELRG